MSLVFRNDVPNSRAGLNTTGITYRQNTTGVASRGTGAPAFDTYAYHDFPSVGQDFADLIFETTLGTIPADGTTVTFSGFMWQNTAVAGAAYLLAVYDYLLADGTTGTDSYLVENSLQHPTASTWTPMVGHFNPIDFYPSGNLVSISNVKIAVRYQFMSGLPAFQLRSTFMLAVLNPNPANPYGGNYFDGAFGDGPEVVYDWLGAAFASPSTITISDVAPLAPPSTAVATPQVPTPVAGVASRSYSPINLTGFSVIEDSTPVDPSDTTGGYGQFTLVVAEREDTRYLQDVPMNLSVVSQGETTGTVRGLSGVDGVATVTGDSRLAALNSVRTAQPVNGTVSSVFTYYLSLVEITTGIVIDTSIASTPVVFPGWSGNVWDQMRKMALSLGAEVSLVSNNVVLRPIRLRDAETYRDASRSWNLDSTQLARSVEVYYYQSAAISSSPVYPVGGWSKDVPIFTVGLAETQEFDIPLSASLSSISQPVAQDFVDRYYTSTSVYAVTDSDGLPYLAAQWTADGGSVTVVVNEDTKSITVTVKAPTTSTIAGPYSIAVAAGPSDRYSSLRLVGTGVGYTKELVTLATSVDTDRVTVEVGATVDNEFITTRDQAVHAGLWALKRWGAPRYTITVTSGGVNRLGDNGSYRYPTVAEFDVVYSGDLVSDFDTEWSGDTITDFNEYMVSLVSNAFENQAFGNIAGARVEYRDVIFRIRTATNTDSSITYTAEDDTTVADFDNRWDTMTVADFNSVWLGQPLSDFPKASLRSDR